MNWRSCQIFRFFSSNLKLNEKCVVKSNKNHIVFRLFAWNRRLPISPLHTHISLQEFSNKTKKEKNLSWSIFNKTKHTHTTIRTADLTLQQISNGKCIYSVGWSFVYHVNLSWHYDFCISITFFRSLESFRLIKWYTNRFSSLSLFLHLNLCVSVCVSQCWIYSIFNFQCSWHVRPFHLTTHIILYSIYDDHYQLPMHGLRNDCWVQHLYIYASKVCHSQKLATVICDQNWWFNASLYSMVD